MELKDRNKTVIVLGGTAPHIELIKQLKSRGYYVILVDYLDNPPAKEFADIHIQESTMDFDAVIKIAKTYNVQLVISACVDQANITACYVAEKLGLTKPYSFKIANDITNKGIMKKVMFENNIPTTKYLYLEKNDELSDFTLKYTVNEKPVDSCAASGVKKANSIEELKKFLQEAKEISRSGRTIIEEYYSGVEVSAYCFVQDFKVSIIMVSERLSVIEGENQVLKCYATITPPNISKIAMEKLSKAANDIAKSFNLDNTPLHVQAIINGDDINIIEFAPRVGGGISYQTIRDNTGFDIIGATIDSYLQRKVDLRFSELKYYYSVNLIYGIPSVFDHIEGAEQLIKENIIESIHYHKTKGMKILNNRASSERIAAFLVKGNSREEVCRKVEYAMKNLKAYDVSGNMIMRTDLYIKK